MRRKGLTLEQGWRLAGLTDGEGHFGISRRKQSYMCEFVIALRDDDEPLLRRLQETTGLGLLYHAKKRLDGHHDICRWYVTRKQECLRLVEIFNACPLWSKKARDFEVWRKAVLYWNGPRLEGWAPMERWYHEIREARGYIEPSLNGDAPITKIAQRQGTSL